MAADETYGHICGRFQPFHRKHLEYARLASEVEEVDILIIGITNADPGHIEQEEKDTERHKRKHNPFMYHERFRMIRDAIEESEISKPFHIMPFPINKPELWRYYAPEEAIHCIGMVDEWNEEKASKIERTGRQVRRIEMDPELDGEELRATNIRKRMAEGRQWQHRVPDAVAEFIEQKNLERRVKKLYGTGG